MPRRLCRCRCQGRGFHVSWISQSITITSLALYAACHGVWAPARTHYVRPRCYRVGRPLTTMLIAGTTSLGCPECVSTPSRAAWAAAPSDCAAFSRPTQPENRGAQQSSMPKTNGMDSNDTPGTHPPPSAEPPSRPLRRTRYGRHRVHQALREAPVGSSRPPRMGSRVGAAA